MRGPLALLLAVLGAWLPLLEGARILTVVLYGGSHYLLMDRVSQILQDHGHDVSFLQRSDLDFPSGFKREKTYQSIHWSPPDKFKQELKKILDLLTKEAFLGRNSFRPFLEIMKLFGTHCSDVLGRTDIMGPLHNGSFDLVVVDGLDLCAFLIAEKLARPFVAVLATTFGVTSFGLPEPVSYVPDFHSSLTDRMDFWGRVTNSLMFFISPWRQRYIHGLMESTIREHFLEGSRPDLCHLQQKAELWFVNSDFAFDFARPLLPNTVYVGGLMAKPVEPIPQDLEDFIAQFGEAGFVLVALGTIVDVAGSRQALEQMHRAFAQLPQGVIWKCSPSLWPEDIPLAANVKLMHWLPQSDLLAHPSIRLFVTHGGMNSVMESIQHGVPMVGIPLLVDQPGNFIRVEAKHLGVSIPIEQLNAETLALKMKQVIGDKSYKSAAVAASIIRRSHPLTPVQRLVGWIDHILQTGGAAHLKPYAFQQPWYEQYLLDVFLFLLGVALGAVWLCGKLLGLVARGLCGARKLKRA
ncbi:UDP-glucuronosyltransferase 3A2 isoform X1 [Pipistrellus kuhlii]|uniref:UDP-glucuronosyltransferase n=1 Tax=Pipistrellus kuhlii TaxID=59472 RepID=A0A7J7YZI2_PIPKU|nr:UDP-glucuronosyltransferase 3A2 isoform X1 [Pipistrellus kuhlii]KAF6367314.1 UDP glycosyltransferase family 3 member A1 [Pipistrellus kuhlii]